MANKYKDLKKTYYDIETLNKLAKETPSALIKECENNYKLQIKSVVNTIIKNDYKIVLVAGPSSSGKTTSANFISQSLLQKGIGSVVVSMDNFFVDIDDTPLLPDGMPDFENINCVDIKTFNAFIKDLLTKHKAKMPIFDFLEHRRSKWETLQLDKNDIVIIEGIHCLNPELLTTNKFNDAIYKLYISVDSIFRYKNEILFTEQDVRLMRRTYRDSLCRGREPIQTLKQWKHVCEGEEIYIKPFKHLADDYIDSTHPYEVLIYSNYLEPLLNKKSKLKLEQRLLENFKHITTMKKNAVPDNSLIWEFLVNKE